MIKVDLQRKLNNNEGKTILMALFLLLVAIVVSVVIIGAATTAAHQLNDNKDAQQAYLTASSAAQLFRDEIAGKTYTHTLAKKYNYRGTLKDTVNPEIKITNSQFSTLLGTVVSEIKDSIKNSTTEGTYSYELNSKEVTLDGFDNVIVNIKVYGGRSDSETATTSSNSKYSYDMDVSFEVKDDDDKQGYKLNLNIPITATTEDTNGSYDYYDSERYYYNYYTWEQTTTTITFGAATITREGLTYNQGGNQ